MHRLLMALAVLAAGGGMASCTKAEGHTDEPTTSRPVRALEVRAIAPRGGIRYSVAMQPREQIALAFKASGYVAEIRQRRGADGRSRPLQAGDAVAAGSVVARLRDADYRATVDQAAGSLREAEAAEVKARLDLDRASHLFAAEALTKPDLDAAHAAFEGAAARVAAAHARVRLAEISLRDTTLTAPLGGVVLERRIEGGTLVGVGTPAFVLADVSSVKALFGVPDSLVHRIASGQALDVTTDAFPGTRFAGRVTAIAPAADPVSRVFGVELTIANADGLLKPGMIGTVEVPIGAAGAAPEGQASVPLSAVVRPESAGGAYAVFVVDGEAGRAIARLRRVALGDVHGDEVAVTEGIAAGERVIVMGATLLTDGEPVRIIP
jgi:RND family efflux transporter MFP subunit